MNARDGLSLLVECRGKFSIVAGLLLCTLFCTVFSIATAPVWAEQPPETPPTTPSPEGPQEAPAFRFLERHCADCHTGDRPKGNFHLDQLSADFGHDVVRKKWLAARQRIVSGEMPPQGRSRPNPEEIAKVSNWIHDTAEQAVKAQRATQGRVVLRRLNRVEYENTVRDLLGISVELRDLLPPDSSSGGFDNVGDTLHTSSFLMDRYLEAADKALSLAIANLPQPPLLKQRYSLKEERLVQTTTEDVYLKRGDTVVMFSSSPWNAITVGQFYPPNRGQYRIRIAAFGHQSDGKPVSYRIDAGPMLMGTKNHLVSYFDAAPDKSTVVEFIDNFEARNHIRIHPYGLANAQTVTKVGAEKFTGAGLGVEYVEVEGPLHATWPPASHRRIFGDLSQGPAPNYQYSNRVEVVSQNPLVDADRIVRNFARRAFRRPVTDADVKPFTALVEKRLAEKQTFEQAIRVALTAIMVSPEFLFLQAEPGRLDPFALASRLSYFLWSSMPDEELLELASQTNPVVKQAPGIESSAISETAVSRTISGERTGLADPKVLRAQVDRMLNHPKSQQFVENFVGQWLGLRDIDFTEPTHILYPEFDDMLKASMVKETELFFAEVLKDDLSLTNFIASDFTMLNGRLAKHYGIPGIHGWDFQRTQLPAESHRGGVLTMASVLKVTANGTSTSPVMRGAWVLERILGTTPPRPPENVPALEPDTRGTTTIREQLARHREIEACAGCHRLIDPPGFALESFDVIGGYREYYRTSGNGKPVMVEGRQMHYLEGPPVDPSDVLQDGRAFRNIDEFKQLLLSNKDLLARALTAKLLTYATGAISDNADQLEIDGIVAKARERNYGFRTLVHELVASDLFQHK